MKGEPARWTNDPSRVSTGSGKRLLLVGAFTAEHTPPHAKTPTTPADIKVALQGKKDAAELDVCCIFFSATQKFLTQKGTCVCPPFVGPKCYNPLHCFVVLFTYPRPQKLPLWSQRLD